jgi:hypothetical protein
VNAGNAAYNNNKHYRQTANLSLAGYASSANEDPSYPAYAEGWIPIGANSSNFQGTFDGNGYAITDLEIETPPWNGDNSRLAAIYGLFGHNSGGTIKNVTLSGSVTGLREVGGIAGTNTGTITNCSYSGSVYGYLEIVGGLAGYNQGTITASTHAGTVIGDNYYVGGVVGTNATGGFITACRNTGDVTGSNVAMGIVGGIAGTSSGGSNLSSVAGITACYNTGDVTGTKSGGVVGQNGVRSAITACYNTGAVTGNTGGVAWDNDGVGATITACYYSDGGAGAGGTEFGTFGVSDWPVNTDTGWSNTNWKNLNGSPTGHPQLWWE